MTCLRPDIVIRPDSAGRFTAACLACMDKSAPSFHKPIAEAWRRGHIAESRVAK